MKFFKRNNADTAAIPEDLQPYYTGQDTGIKRWIAPILRGLVLLLVLVALVWGGIALVHHFTKKDTAKDTNQQGSSQKFTPTPKTTSQTTSPTPAAKQPVASAPTPTATAGPTATKTPNPTPTATPTPVVGATPAPAAAGSTQLTNTGPGAVAALFGSVTIVSALAYRFYLLRRLAN